MAIELAVEDLLPRTEVQLALRDRHDDFAPHHLPLQVGVGVFLAGPVVGISLRRRIKRSELLQALLEFLMQT